MLDAETIAESSLEEFIAHYETVKSLIENQDHLQRLVDAVNDRLKDVPEGFRPAELSLGTKSPPKQKTWRLDDDQKFAWAYKAAESMSDKTFVFADLWRWFDGLRKTLNVVNGVDLAASKSSLSAGVKMLVEKGILARHVPKNDEGKEMFARTEYELKPAFKKSKHQLRKTVDEMFEEAVVGLNVNGQLEQLAQQLGAEVVDHHELLEAVKPSKEGVKPSKEEVVSAK